MRDIRHHPPELTLDRLNILFLLCILLISYAYFIPRWADQSANSRMDMIVAVVDDGTFQIDRYVSNTVDYAQYNGHYYSDKPPGTAILGIPVYWGIKNILRSSLMDNLVNRLSNNAALQATLNPQGTGIFTEKLRFAIAQVLVTYFLAMLPSLVLAWLLYRYMRKIAVSPRASVLLVLGYSLATPAFAYATALYSHQLSAALLFAAFYLASGLKKNGAIPRLLGIGFLLGYAVISEYPVVLVAGIIFFYTLYRVVRQGGQWLQMAWTVMPALALLAGWMAYNQALFGSPLTFGYDYSTAWTAQHHTGFMSLTYPHWAAIWGITFSPYRGLFILAPFMLLFFPGMITWWRSKTNRAEWVVILAVAVSMFLFDTSSVMWWGGFAVGPRYILPSLPFITLAVGIFFKYYLQHVWAQVLTGILLACSLISTWGLTLAGQAFPSDVIQNPYTGYAFPNWQQGNIARNIGTLAGLRGITSLVPLVLGGMAIVGLWYLLARQRQSRIVETPRQLEKQADSVPY